MSVAPLKAGTHILSAGPEKLIERCGEAVTGADRILQAAKAGVRIKIQEAGSVSKAQHAAHGLAWLATYVQSLRQMLGWARQLEAVQRLRPIADGLEITMAQLALAWVLREPNLASAIVGASRPEQIEENAAASGIELDDATLRAIDEALVPAAV